MPKSEINYSFFSSFIVRTPSYPINFYLNLTKESHIETSTIINILSDNRIRDAIFLASPDFYDVICKWIMKDGYPAEKANKVKLSILKYLIRMSTRSTPFGLFSAIGSGKFSNESLIMLEKYKNFNENTSFYRKTRLDMQLLGDLVHKYYNNSIVLNGLLLYPNTTLYKIAKFYRYIQYTSDKGKRAYSLEGFKQTKYLDLILDKARYGIKRSDLTFILILKKIDPIEAIEFIDELIKHQILVYELELTLTGDDYLNRLSRLVYSIKKSQNISTEELAKYKLERKETNNLILFLDKISNALIEIDTEDFEKNPFILYERLTEIITAKGIPFDKKFLFQTDFFLNNTDFILTQKYNQDINKVLSFLNKISEKPKDSLLENFKKAFTERYDGETVSLVKALDVETGIGYIQHKNFDTTPLLDTLNIKEIPTDNLRLDLSNVEKKILHILQNPYRENKNSVTLKLNDFEDIDFSNENLPCTFPCLFEIVEENNKELISIQNIEGSSAANLSARFCYGNEQIEQFANEIIRYESNNFADKIIAEIIHLPENRTGNVLRRPNFRFYEIPYLGQSSLPLDQQINIEDIMLFLDNGRLVMWSKRYNKEIIPRLTNAHNYSYNSLPIYQFLCDMQFENCKPSISLNHYKLEKILDYFPRMIIENCIVSKQKWIFTKEKHSTVFERFKEINIVYHRSIFSIELIFSKGTPPLPRYVSLVDFDNTLIIDLENKTCIEMLVESVKNRSLFVLEEYLFPSKKLVNDTGKNYYGNQFIVGIKWKRK